MSSTAGYSGKPLVTKLGIKPGHRLQIVQAPAGFELEGLPDDVRIVGSRARSLDVILLFVQDVKGLRSGFAGHAPRLTEAGMMWVAWPKRSSKIPTDMTEDRVREVVLPLGYVDVKVCAIDETWSGLKVVKRLERRSAD